MPTYVYSVSGHPARRFEVRHCRSVAIATWGELCELGRMGLDEISADTPLIREAEIGCGGQGCGCNHGAGHGHDHADHDHAHSHAHGEHGHGSCCNSAGHVPQTTG